MSDNVQILINSGFDAFSNLYKVAIYPPTPVFSNLGIASTEGYEVRAQDFKCPSLPLGEYATDYKTVQLTRVNAMFGGEREFSLRFRIDSTWQLYTELKKWKMKYVNIAQDQVYMNSLANASDNSAMYGKIQVSALNGAGVLASDGVSNAKMSWTFNHVMLYDIIEPTFGRTDSKPVEIECKFLFGEYTVAGEV